MNQPGPFGVTIHEVEDMPDDLIVVVGTCACRHSAISHTDTGCSPDLNCDCDVPISRLYTVIHLR